MIMIYANDNREVNFTDDIDSVDPFYRVLEVETEKEAESLIIRTCKRTQDGMAYTFPSLEFESLSDWFNRLVSEMAYLKQFGKPLLNSESQARRLQDQLEAINNIEKLKRGGWE